MAVNKKTSEAHAASVVPGITGIGERCVGCAFIRGLLNDLRDTTRCSHHFLERNRQLESQVVTLEAEVLGLRTALLSSGSPHKTATGGK